LTQGAREAAELLARYGLEPRKALGQHFVVDPNTIDRIVRVSGVTATDRVVEVGPGLGALTVGLAQTGAQVTVVEIDGDLVPILQEQTRDLGVRVVHQDAMQVDWDALLGDHHGWHLIANLPYNVGTPLLLDLLDTAPQITEFTVMVQREVAERLVASADTAEYGIPSVKVAFWATGELAGRVSASVFLPPPRVESALVRLHRRATPAVDVDPQLLFSLVKQAFGQRRKMLRKSLGERVTAEQFAAAGVEPTARPAELDIAAWGRLALAL